MLTIENVSYSFPQKDLFEKISFTLEENQHCAFIGASGSGKSTLIELIINAEEALYDGKISLSKGTIGYVRQFVDPDLPIETTVFEYVSEPFTQLQNEIDDLCAQMGTSDASTDMDTLLSRYQEALDTFEARGGDSYESSIDKKLHLADLKHLRNQRIADLSGGEFKLVQAIREMMCKPHLLIMDEPDVFLDFENLIALRKLINAHKGILLVVTHNRYLLNHCFNKIIHLEGTDLQEFDGSYPAYNFERLKTKIDLQERSIADDIEIERNEKLIHKLRLIATSNSEASRGKALKARVRFQERLVANRIKAPFVNIKEPKIAFHTEPLGEDLPLLSVDDYTVSYDDILLKNVSFEIKSSEKVALIGPNGTGKTTLLRDIMKNSKDSICFHENAHPAYLSQVQGETLDESLTLLDAFFEAGFNSIRMIQSHASQYGFDEAMLNQPITKLSGGEKNLLQLAIVAAGKANILLLDEPTSHLDTYSQMALEKAVLNFPGAVLMISHDYYTLANCVDYVLLIEDQTVRKMSVRKFRKMIYGTHFDKDYLEIEQKKKALETKIEMALKNNDYEEAKLVADLLEPFFK